MKRLQTTLLSTVMCLTFLAASAQKADEIISSYTGANASGYLQPLADVLTSTFNTGHIHKTSVDSGFHFYIGLTAFSTWFTDDKSRYFMGTTPNGFLPVQEVRAPTILGPREIVTVNGMNGTSYTFPAGLGTKSVLLAVPQITIGSILGTEFNVRFFGYDFGGDFGKLQFLGGGVRHDIGRYFLKNSRFRISAEYCYQKLNVGNYADLTTHKAGVYAGQQGKLFNYYAYVGYQNGAMNIDYQGSSDASPVHIPLTNKNPLLLAAGMGVRLWIFRLNVHGSFIRPVVAAASLGLSF
ncbi:DUF6588 family protein [Runella sp.]|uniref:DUF6588 family protein n=1 Tax=Runella sp. TaxID=1960881 RepID=UPI003D1289C6